MANQPPPGVAPNLLPSGIVPGAIAAGGAHNPFWHNIPGLPGPMMGGFIPYNQLAAYASAQENALPMVSISKLSFSKSKANTNSSLVVRGSLRRVNALGGTLSVAEWTRKTLEENLDWLVKLAKRHATGEKAVFFIYGDGCETLLLLDGQVNKMPDDLTKVKKISIGCTMAEIESNFEEENLAKMGVLQPKDSIWEHLRYETIDSTKPLADGKPPKGLFIHTKTSLFGESVDGRRRVLQVTTGSNLGYKPNPTFEQQVLNKWRETFPPPFLPMAPMAGMPLAALPIGAMPMAVPMNLTPAIIAPVQAEKETVITFNPKELLLLEKAFDNRLTERDIKTSAAKYTAQDKIAAQAVIRRAQSEFIILGPPRKRKPKNDEATMVKPSKKAKTNVPSSKEKEDDKPVLPKKASSEEKPKATSTKKVGDGPAKKASSTEKEDAKPALPKMASSGEKPKATPVKKVAGVPAKKGSSKEKGDDKPVLPKKSTSGKKPKTSTVEKAVDGPAKKPSSKEKDDDKPVLPKKASSGGKPKSSPVKKEKDDDDVPISKMVSATKIRRTSTSPKKAPPKPSSSAPQEKGTKPKETEPKKKPTTEKEAARGRTKGSSKKRDESPKKRSTSQSKK